MITPTKKRVVLRSEKPVTVPDFTEEFRKYIRDFPFKKEDGGLYHLNVFLLGQIRSSEGRLVKLLEDRENQRQVLTYRTLEAEIVFLQNTLNTFKKAIDQSMFFFDKIPKGEPLDISKER